MVLLENCTKSLSKINATVQNLLQKTEKQEILPSVFYEANEITKYNSGESSTARLHRGNFYVFEQSHKAHMHILEV